MPLLHITVEISSHYDSVDIPLLLVLEVRKYSLYKKKRKHYIIFNNLRTFKDEHFKLTGDLY